MNWSALLRMFGAKKQCHFFEHCKECRPAFSPNLMIYLKFPNLIYLYTPKTKLLYVPSTP
jgi:hypothetical protein